ncbi:MAG: hypothetical protein N2246_07350 [Candidatus Sumerlaeia bacterium]|nr:hypothetical protein [Candidatus Sumerlaeia bacterium]
MPFRTSKEKLSLEEIKGILKSNLNLYMNIYKNDPEFLDYFIELTLYLLRYKYDKSEELMLNKGVAEGELPEPDYRILQSAEINNDKVPGREYCHFCGAELQGQRKCSVCGNISI